MKEFLVLQKRLFPVYFGTQVGLTALTAATCPPYSILSLLRNPWSVGSLAVVAIDGLSKLVRVRPEDDDCRVGKKGTAWYVWLEYVCC